MYREFILQINENISMPDRLGSLLIRSHSGPGIKARADRMLTANKRQIQAIVFDCDLCTRRNVPCEIFLAGQSMMRIFVCQNCDTRRKPIVEKLSQVRNGERNKVGRAVVFVAQAFSL